MPELILVNGKLYTQDEAYPHATAVAVQGGRIVAVGNDEDLLDLAGRNTQVVDLRGQLVLPGLVDGHFHFYHWALAREQLPLGDAVSWQDIEGQVKQAAANRPPDKWILGSGWNETSWTDQRLPDRTMLDAVAPHHPTLLFRNDMHIAVANSAALAAGHVTADTPDPVGGVVDRAPDGQPTGVLRDIGMNLVSEAIPPVSEAETVAAMRRGMRYLHSLGVTGLHDYRVMGGICGLPAFRAWQRFHADGDLNLRVWMHLPGERIDEVIALGLRTGFGDERLRVGALKFFVDGSQGARTAWMLEPYEDGGTGISITPIPEIADALCRAEEAGLAVAVHAIGDRANRELIAALAQAIERRRTNAEPAFPLGRIANVGRAPRTAPPAAPHRVEHVQVIHPDDISAFARLGVVASVQPLQATDDIPMIETSIGSRARFAYSFRALADAGVTLALGSDAPVAEPNPMWGIHAAVTRCRRDGTPAGGWYPEERLTVAQAVWGYTMGTALASGRQGELGSITPGKLADFAVVDQDLFNIPPMSLADARITMTIFNGQIVHGS